MAVYEGYPRGRYGCDLEGRPIIIERAGHINISKIMENLT